MLYISSPGEELEEHRIEQLQNLNSVQLATAKPDYVLFSDGDNKGIHALAVDTQARPVDEHFLPF